jgi:transposase
MRLGWFSPVHCKSVEAQETRALLTARKLVQSKLHDIELSLRGILRGFGLKVGPTTPKLFEARIKELVEGHPSLQVVAEALLAVRTVLVREFNGFEKRVRSMARSDARTRLLMSTPGVGTIVALTYVSAIDDPKRFKSSKMVGSHFGLTPKKYQSGETDITGRISKIGDASVRAALYEAAHVILTRPVKGSNLKSWAARIAKRAGMKTAKVALAPQAGGYHASHAGRRQAVQLCRGRGAIIRSVSSFGRVSTPAFPKRSPSPGRWIRSDRNPPSGIATTLT